MPTDKLYSPKEVREITKASKINLVRWTELGIIKPVEDANGRGSRRVYSRRNIVEAMICHQLNKLRMESSGIKKVMNCLRDRDILRMGKFELCNSENAKIVINLDKIRGVIP